MAILGYPLQLQVQRQLDICNTLLQIKTKQEKTTTTTKYNRSASLAKFNKQPKSADAIRNR